jgi:hypothetical protein
MPRPRAHWIRLDYGVHNHPKIIALAENFATSRSAIVGHLASLWLWCSVYRPNGRTEGLTDGVLAEAASWAGDAAAWRTELVRVRILERGRHGEQLRGWTERNGYQHREAVRSRVRTPSNPARIPRDTRTNPAPQDRTGQDIQDKKKKTLPKPPQASALGGWLALFPDFWRVYPRKVAKKAAEKAWTKLTPASQDLIKPTALAIAYVLRDRKQRDWAGRDLDRIPYPATFLNAEKFEVHHEAV